MSMLVKMQVATIVVELVSLNVVPIQMRSKAVMKYPGVLVYVSALFPILNWPCPSFVDFSFPFEWS
jgi:hypothetical protein